MRGLIFGSTEQDREIGEAVVKSAAAKPTPTYSLSGRLYKSDSGWVLLSVPNALARGAFDALDEQGVELPPGKPTFNAHISVIRPEELDQLGGADKVTERGHTFRYQLGKLKSVSPAGWKEMSKVWFIEVKSPELEKLRKSYGLSARPKDNEFAFHITVAVRRKKVLQTGEVSKAAFSLPWLKAAKKKKREQPAGYVKETEEIKARRETAGAKPHKFEAAEWTHPNGHPRCKICGDEETIDGQCDGYKAAAAKHIPTVGVDFDGTIAQLVEPFESDVSKLKPRPGAKKWMKKFQDAGARIIIFTVRGDAQAIKDWCHTNDIPYDYVNENPDQPPDASGKVFADVYWDDRAISASGALDNSGADVLAVLEKDAGLEDAAKGVMHHLPRIRLPDTIIGAGLGTAAGLGTYGIRSMTDDKEDPSDDPSLLRHLLTGSLVGAAGGNLVGDRARRYLSNAVRPIGYRNDALEYAKDVTPKKIWEHAILDKPMEGGDAGWTGEEGIEVRRELLRRTLGLPPWLGRRQRLQYTGETDFTPTTHSGGVPGRYPEYQMTPETMKKLDFTPPGSTYRDQILAGQEPRAYPGSDLQKILGAYGLRYNPDTRTMTATDLWDFAPTDSENAQFWHLIKLMMTNPSSLSKPVGDWTSKIYSGEWHRGETTAPTGWQQLRDLARRKLLQTALPRKGVVVNQDYRIPEGRGAGVPAFRKAGVFTKMAATPYWQRAGIAQLHQPQWFPGRGILNNIVANLLQARQRGQQMVTAQDTAKDMVSSQSPQAALSRMQNFLSQGDHVTDPLDRALFRPLPRL